MAALIASTGALAQSSSPLPPGRPARGAFAQSNSPLPPGKPAGVEPAMQRTTETNLLSGIAAAGVGLMVLVVDAAGKKSSAGAATTTSP